MRDPLFWLGLSLIFVALSAIAVILAALPTLREIQRTARSARRLIDTLDRDLPPTLEAIRLTGLELTELTDELNDGVSHATHVVKQVDVGLTQARAQAQRLQIGSQSLWAGLGAAWQTWRRSSPKTRLPRRRPRR
ncbi:MAG: DUF948 domain-containing protein [Spirulina sp. SIO3F2]|nr:DUF948 domain-containing protein [Spirulina sp. SIO3F2]